MVNTVKELLDHVKESATDALKTTSKRQLKKAEVTGNLIGNKFDLITFQSLQNSLETVTNETERIEFDKKIPKRKYISPERRQKDTKSTI